MKLYRRTAAVLLFLAIAFGLIWAVAKYMATPPPTGDVYQLASHWPRLPNAVEIGQVSGIGVDSRGDVFVFHRAEKVWEGEELPLELIPSSTVFVLDDEMGALIDQWGAGTFVMPHGLTVDHEDNLWLTDVGLHQVFKFDRAGNLLMTLGERGIAGEDAQHFNMPTDVAVEPDGSFYVSDGYGNSRVIKFSPDGSYLMSWGSKGTAPGQFDVPHSIALDSQGQVYVADRGNARLQIFDENGQFINEWQDKSLGRPWAVRISANGNVFVIDGGDQSEFWPDRARILKLDSDGQILASFGSYGDAPGQFIWPHTIALGPDEELYIGEVSTGMRIQKFTK
ncbi:MAG TPA: peptidyl-alpha-hydroxyglycine alpha-amidating lyase family protein [Anaerolineales bacterium]|nr:peptidyl-alpha-hydroxyglycine alpha-amidating lyase family protein [Anaerolineales bacterium]